MIPETALLSVVDRQRLAALGQSEKSHWGHIRTRFRFPNGTLLVEARCGVSCTPSGDKQNLVDYYTVEIHAVGPSGGHLEIWKLTPLFEGLGSVWNVPYVPLDHVLRVVAESLYGVSL